MKNLKFIYLSIVIAIFALVSCDNNDTIIDVGNPHQSESVKIAMSELQSHFNTDGSLSGHNNPTGNILFDFCFDFKLPITLSYNNGTTVTINEFNDLVEVLINMTEELYIDGVVFPFEVEVFDEETDSVVVQTINNEEEFVALVSSCGFEVDPCICTEEEYIPVCVEIQAPNGDDKYTIQFPSACIAICQGFTEDDFVECEDYDNPGPGHNDCFEFVFPISVIDKDGNTVEVEDESELRKIRYTNCGRVKLVYPFDVTLADGTVKTIADKEAFHDLLDTCFDDYHKPCNCTAEYEPVCVKTKHDVVIGFPNMCIAECAGFTQEDVVDCNMEACNCTAEYEPVCVKTKHDVVIGFPNMCIAECAGYTQEDVVDDCEEYTDVCWEFVFPISFTTEGDVKVTVNNQEEFENDFDLETSKLVYPFDIEVKDKDGETDEDKGKMTVETQEQFDAMGGFEKMCQ